MSEHVPVTLTRARAAILNTTPFVSRVHGWRGSMGGEQEDCVRALGYRVEDWGSGIGNGMGMGIE